MTVPEGLKALEVKREHGAVEDFSTNSMAAPATVGGKLSRKYPLDLGPGRGEAALDPQARRPAFIT
jgi:hypothetical protein